MEKGREGERRERDELREMEEGRGRRMVAWEHLSE